MSLATPTFRDGPARGLDALVAESRRHSAEFPDVLANHLPMILVALDRLGASQARQAGFFASYSTGKGLLPAPEPVAPIDGATWTTILGDRRREADARLFFTAETRRLGIFFSVSAYLERFSMGFAGSKQTFLARPVRMMAFNHLSFTSFALTYLVNL